MNLSEARILVREYLGERALAAPESAPSMTFESGGAPFWAIGSYQTAVHFIYKEGISERGPVDTDTPGGANEHLEMTAIPTGGSGVIGRLIVSTRAGGTTFYKVKAIMDNTTTTYDAEAEGFDDSDLTDPVFNYAPKTSDDEIDFLLNFYNKQVQQITGVVRRTSNAELVRGTSEVIAFANSNPDTITRTVGSFIDDGFLPGQTITIDDAEDAANEDDFTIATVAAQTITLVASDALTANANDGTATIVGKFITVEDQADYDIPSDALPFNETVQMFVDGRRIASKNIYDLDRMMPNYRDPDNTPSGTPLVWYMEFINASEFKLLPVPDETNASLSIEFKYSKNLAEMTASTDEFLEGLFPESHMTIVFATVSDLFAKRNDQQNSGIYLSKYRNELDRTLKTFSANRKVQDTIQVQRRVIRRGSRSGRYTTDLQDSLEW